MIESTPRGEATKNGSDVRNLTTHSTRAEIDGLSSARLVFNDVVFRRVNSGVSTDRKRRAVNAMVSTRRFEVGLTTHSTGAEIARFSFARLKAARRYFPPG